MNTISVLTEIINSHLNVLIYKTIINLLSIFTYVCNQTNIYFQVMSHINDLISVLRGLRLVVEAGVKTQQELSSLIWNNSSVKPLLLNCPTNLFTYNPNPASAKELVDRALVVAHGFRQFATMHVPNMSNNSTASPAMDQQMKDEIDELNKEFNRTFNTLKKVQFMDDIQPEVKPATREPSDPVSPTIQILAPIEDLHKRMQDAELQRAEKLIEAMSSSEPMEPSLVRGAGSAGPKPIAKKKTRISVSIT